MHGCCRKARCNGCVAHLLELELTYSLTLLKPREYSVPTDGKRHVLPGLGYCSAKVDEPGNRIDVDCFSAFNYPAQISAELNEIPASRVFVIAAMANPTWISRRHYVQWPYSQRVKLAIGSPRLDTARQHHGHRVGCGGTFPEVPGLARHSGCRFRDLPFAHGKQALPESELARCHAA